MRHMQAGILTQADTAAPAFPDYVSSGLWGPLSQYSNGIVRDSHPLPFSVRFHAHLHTHMIYFSPARPIRAGRNGQNQPSSSCQLAG